VQHTCYRKWTCCPQCSELWRGTNRRIRARSPKRGVTYVAQTGIPGRNGFARQVDVRRPISLELKTKNIGQPRPCHSFDVYQAKTPLTASLYPVSWSVHTRCRENEKRLQGTVWRQILPNHVKRKRSALKWKTFEWTHELHLCYMSHFKSQKTPTCTYTTRPTMYMKFKAILA